ncbi:hypothetical protein LTR66_015858 [Elasticomyces elasticus]|nr:hypothetical protein LTR66_015858 [Elasticomyces elasticus]
MSFDEESGDPFLEVQSDVRTLLASTRTLFSSYLRIRSQSSRTSTTKSSSELAEAGQELTSNLETLTSDLQDLLESIRAIEDDPYRFGLDAGEVKRRQKFVQDVSRELESMRRELNSSTNQSSIGLPDPDAFSTAEPEDDSYEQFEHQQQQTMMREQDEQIDGVFQTVGVIRGQAEEMGRELDEQGVMLDEVDTLADRVGGKLEVGRRRITEVIRRGEDKYSSCCIGGLIVVLIILLVLVIII